MIKAYFITMALLGAAAFAPAIDALLSDTPSGRLAAHAGPPARPAMLARNPDAAGDAGAVRVSGNPSAEAEARKAQHDRFADHFRAGDDIRQVAVSLFRDQ